MIDALSKQHYRDWISEEFAARKQRNSAYSIRAFARFLGVSKTALAEVLAGKRDFSKRAALAVAERLAFSPGQKSLMLAEIQKRASGFTAAQVDHLEFLQLQEDQFKLISDWYYIGILALAQLPTHRADPRWISKRLGISEAEAKTAQAALERMGLIDLRDGRMVRTTLPIQTTHQIPSPALRKYHRQNLRLAEASLERDPIDKRTFGAISIPLDPKDLGKADALIQEFKLRMASLMDTTQPKEVYTLSVQLFPVTREGEP